MGNKDDVLRKLIFLLVKHRHWIKICVYKVSLLFVYLLILDKKSKVKQQQITQTPDWLLMAQTYTRQQLLLL